MHLLKAHACNCALQAKTTTDADARPLQECMLGWSCCCSQTKHATDCNICGSCSHTNVIHDASVQQGIAPKLVCPLTDRRLEGSCLPLKPAGFWHDSKHHVNYPKELHRARICALSDIVGGLRGGVTESCEDIALSDASTHMQMLQRQQLQLCDMDCGKAKVTGGPEEVIMLLLQGCLLACFWDECACMRHTFQMSCKLY